MMMTRCGSLAVHARCSLHDIRSDRQINIRMHIGRVSLNA